MNIGVHVSFQIMVFLSEYMPWDGIPGYKMDLFLDGELFTHFK